MQNYQDQQRFDLFNSKQSNELNSSQILQQTLYQGQYRSQTPQQRLTQFNQQQQPQPQAQQQQEISTQIPLDSIYQQTNHWQDQLQLLELSRKSNITHFYARHAAINSRRNKSEGISKPQSLIELTKHLLDSDNSQIVEQNNTGINNNNNNNNNSTNNNTLMHNKKTSHDTDEQEDFDDNSIPRIKLKEFPDQLWGALDLSGQNIPYLSPNLFKYEFLTKLYLNGNNLKKLPKSIKNLKYLKILDVSNNNLNSIPIELGLLFHLKYLYLFDNNLQTLPQELGNLFELNFIGIEGNPKFDLSLAKILAQRGTRSLIFHLRDNVSNNCNPPIRKWIQLKDDLISQPYNEEEDHKVKKDDQDEDEDEEEEENSFTVYSHNILCHHYATKKLFNYTPSWALSWEYRRDILKNQILGSKADVICLQEVETQSFEDFWTPLMHDHGYRGLFHAKYRARRMNEKEAKKVDGCAIFYKVDTFTLYENHVLDYTQIVLNSSKYKKTDDVFNRLQSRDNGGLITILTHKKTGENVLIANTHLHWDPALNDVKTVQAGVLLEKIEEISQSLNKDIKSIPLLICGDFNSKLDSAVYELLSNGFVKDHEDVEGRDYGKFTEVGFTHPFNLRSSYDLINHIKFTNFTPSFTDVLDYIFYTPSTLNVRGLLDGLDDEYTGHYVGLPNSHLASDHLSLLTKFSFKRKNHSNFNNSNNTPIKKDFGSGRSRKT
ncbi:hypothetical protein WICMUC_000924 [Wickerhamomyces mucosus]|uniref:CCR4-Not complex 3'-5'-exoribonuclease subunit Ccr4 n=1 Tax=Wickerhamomyces mucosus TaxID=1378264 RepID=A0A9P8TH87_9ASCO|nr:hypothetical protein WICMUC_000924 [Wickerhamomyces mucosus]